MSAFLKQLSFAVCCVVLVSACSSVDAGTKSVEGGVEGSVVSPTADAPQPGEVEGSRGVVPFDEFDPADYEVGDVVPEVEIREPVEYPEMANNDEAGAEAAAQYMLDVLNYTYNTGDISHFEARRDPDCEMCASTLKIINDFYQDGTIPTGPVYEAREISVNQKGENGWILDLTVDYYRTPVVDEELRVLGFFEKHGTFERQMVMSNKSDGWLLRAFGEVAFE